MGFLVWMVAFFKDKRQRLAKLRKEDDEESGIRPKGKKAD